jgi:hypothetical protein
LGQGVRSNGRFPTQADKQNAVIEIAIRNLAKQEKISLKDNRR